MHLTTIIRTFKSGRWLSFYGRGRRCRAAMS